MTKGPTVQLISVPLEHPDGRKVALSVALLDTPQGWQLKDATAMLVFATLSTRQKVGEAPRKGAARDSHLRNSIRAAKAQFEDLGLPGFVWTDGHGGMRVLTWDDYINRPKPSAKK